MVHLSNKSFVFGMFLCVSLLLNSCANSDNVSGINGKADPFVGQWEGGGTDSEGNEFTFVAKVTSQGDGQYRILFFDPLDTQGEPMHIMDGVMKDRTYTYTADDGTFTGAGELDGDAFEGYYKGPVDGTYKMQRVK